jgi:hypothetical protein
MSRNSEQNRGIRLKEWLQTWCSFFIIKALATKPTVILCRRALVRIVQREQAATEPRLSCCWPCLPFHQQIPIVCFREGTGQSFPLHHNHLDFIFSFPPAPEISGGLRRKAVTSGVPHQQKVRRALLCRGPACCLTRVWGTADCLPG